MGFWSALGALGGLAAAPFTGGASMIPMLTGIGGALGGAADALTTGNTAGNIGQVAGNAAQQVATNLNAQNQGINSANRNLIDLFSTQGQNAKDNAAYQLLAPGKILNNAVKGDLAANTQDVSIGGLPSYLHVPTISGGLRPSVLSPTTRTMGQNLTRDAMLQQLTGEKNGYNIPGMPTAPTLAQLQQPGVGTDILGGIGLGSSLVQASSPLIQKLIAGLKTSGGTSEAGQPTWDWEQEGVG